jgi:hypothetical protein
VEPFYCAVAPVVVVLRRLTGLVVISLPVLPFLERIPVVLLVVIMDKVVG